jgi:micrococcal nuclease
MLVKSSSLQFEEMTYATHIQDGDTFQTSAGDWIRLADVDTPEIGEEGFNRATEVLTQLIDGKIVYLDVDDINRFDYGGIGSRLVCLVYTDWNSTHYINVNYWLLIAQVAEIKDFDNEFSPYEWTLFIPKLHRADTMRLLGYSFGIGLISTAVIYIIIISVWNTIAVFVRNLVQ